MKNMRSNKGAAMVSVLIGVSFIIILATSLVYMSYMNYLTKAMRYQGTDNFYTDEFALDDLCMSMQQVAADCTSVSLAMDALLSPTTGVGKDTSGGHTHYTNDCVARMIQVASQEATISVNTVYDTSVSDNLIVDTNSIQLLGLEITSTNENGYQSTICTDVIINFPNGGLGDLDINDFSVIGDSPVRVDEGDVFFSGCVYIDSKGSSTALTVNSAGNVHILSPRGIINGNIVINGSGQLSITGLVTVIGNIYVNDNAVLLCSDQMKLTGEIHKADGARVVGVNHNTFGNHTVDTSEIPANGLGEELLTSVYARDGGDFDEITLHDIQEASEHLEYSVHAQGGRPAVDVKIGLQGTENGTTDTLVLSSRDVIVKGAFSDSTIISNGSILFGADSMPTYMQSMSDEKFEAAKMGLFGSGSGTNGSRAGFAFNPAGGRNPGNYNYNFDGSTYEDMPDPASATAHDTYQGPGGEVRHMIYDNGKNYIPFGYFIADNSSEIITRVFKGVQGNADPVNTNIVVTNWVKE